MKKQETTPPIQPDLKHDNMEYAADSEEVPEPIADDLSFDDNNEEITAEELEALESDIDEDGMALVTAETDSTSDEDNYLTTPDDAQEEEYDIDDNDDATENERQ